MRAPEFFAVVRTSQIDEASLNTIAMGACLHFLVLSVSGNQIHITRRQFAVVLSELHVRIASPLDDLVTIQFCSVKGSRRVRGDSWSNDEVAHQSYRAR